MIQLELLLILFSRGKFSIDKPVDEIRIVILGGSFVFNWNKKVENDYHI